MRGGGGDVPTKFDCERAALIDVSALWGSGDGAILL
jgi:hypothetical protein